MYSRVALLAGVALMAGGCTCLSRVPVPEQEPVEKAAVTAPQAMEKEAEQVIAIAEKSAVAEQKEEVAAASALSAPPPAGVSRCWLKGDMRTIATEQGKDGSCQVVYDSSGQNHVVASKSKDLAECTRLHERLKKNLVASGFKCE